jgi:hypothetical protein
LKHPSYNGESSNLVNDLALIELTQSVTLSSYVSLVCVNQMIDLTIGMPLYVVGWGQIDESLASNLLIIFFLF